MIDRVAVVGAGPAGCATAIELARAGKQVWLLEQGAFPRQKVCGEFVSAECRPLLASLLGEDAPLIAAAPQIDTVRLFAQSRVVHIPLPEAAASIPRWNLDEALWRAAGRAGCECLESCAVRELTRVAAGWELVLPDGRHLQAGAVVDASGRWSRLRPETAPRAKWLGVKAHFLEADAAPSCDLYFFRGGYCGVQPIGDGRVNAAAMVRAEAARDIADVLRLHPRLRERSAAWQCMGQAVSTAPLIFRHPQPVAESILRAGDAAGFNDPFSGSGISLALHSGAAAGKFLAGAASLEEAALAYRSWYADALASSFAFTSVMRSVLLNDTAREIVLRFLPARLLSRQLIRHSRPPSQAA